MNALTQTTGNALANASEPISWTTLEKVLGSAEIEALNPQQAVEYLTNVCRSLGLNPLTRPIRLMTLNGKKVPYATKDCTDQLRSLRNVSLTIADKRIEEDLFIVTVAATMPGGRHDEDVGAVTLGQLRGEARANAIMKAITKAKRRATLSICGLGFLDETEVETIQGADLRDDVTVNTTATARALSDSIPALDGPKPVPPPAKDPLRTLKAKLAECQDAAAVLAVGDAWRRRVDELRAAGKQLGELTLGAAKDMLADAYARFQEPAPEASEPAEDPDDWPGPKVEGEKWAAA